MYGKYVASIVERSDDAALCSLSFLVSKLHCFPYIILNSILFKLNELCILNNSVIYFLLVL